MDELVYRLCLFVKTVLDFYRERGGASGAAEVHAVFLDGVYRDKQVDGDELAFRALARHDARWRAARSKTP